MPPPKKLAEFSDLAELMAKSKLDVNQALDLLPKSSVSFRIPAMHAIALKVVAKEAGLSLSELAERLLCLGINECLTNKVVPGLGDQNPIRLDETGIAGPARPTEGAA